jgi:hypothetical protein
MSAPMKPMNSPMVAWPPDMRHAASPTTPATAMPPSASSIGSSRALLLTAFMRSP